MIDSFESHGIRIPYGATGNVKTTCPRCSAERRKSGDACLSVNVEEGLWHCHHCEWSGSLRRKEDKPRREWVPVETKQVPASEKIYQFFDTRGISRATVDALRITQERKFLPSLGRETECIAFNYFAPSATDPAIRELDTLVNIKFRGPDKAFAQVTGGEHAFYNLASLAADADGEMVSDCIITEGEIDAASFVEAGFPQSLSVPDGAINENVKNPDGKLKCLDTCWEYFERLTDIYLATDADAPGVRLREELARRLGKSRCWIVTYPDGCKDANDVLRLYGPDAVKQCIREARPYPVEGVFTVDDLREDVLTAYTVGFERGVSLGLKPVDELFTWMHSQLSVWTGVPGHMKSSVCDWKNTLLSVRGGWRHAYFTPEHYPLSTHLLRLAQQLVGKPIKALSPHGESWWHWMSEGEIREALAFLRERVIYIQPEDDQFTLEQILASAAIQVRRFGVDNLVIDPWNHIEHQMGSDSETIYTGKALRRIKAFAREHGVHVDLIAHPTKLKPYTDGTFPVATMYDISGSSNWYNVPDNGIVVYRDIDPDTLKTNAVEWHQRKVKYSPYQGRIGKAVLTPSEWSFRFYDKSASVNNTATLIGNGAPQVGYETTLA